MPQRYLLLLAPLAVHATDVAFAEESAPARPAATEPSASAVTTLTLEQAYTRLDAANLDLAVARARAEQAAAVTESARAPLLPTLIGTGSYVRNNEEVSLRVGSFLSQIPGAPNVPDVVIQPLDAWSAAGTLRVPLFVPTAWHASAAANATERAAEATTSVVRQRARAALGSLAYGALALEEVVAAAERSIELARQQVASAERRVSAGTAASLDVTRAEAEKVRREGDLSRARADLERTRLALGVLLGEAAPVRIAAPVESTLLDGTVATATPTEAAFERRPELRIVAAQEAAGDSMKASANSRFFPELHATGSLFASDEPYPTGENTGWRVAVELSIPLYDGGLRYGKRREADAAIALAHAEGARIRLQIRQEIADAERDVRLALERLRLAETRAALAREAAESAQRSFMVGIATSLDVLDANDKLFQADVALAAERARKAQARIELGRARGAL